MEKRLSVLFVDDEENILNSLKRGLIDEDYDCLFASCGKEALDILNKEKVSVLVTDMRMPGMDGLVLLKEVKVKYPDVIRIVLSGYTQLQQVLATINQGEVFKFITKPWKLEEEFKVVINQALDYYRLQQERCELEAALSNKNIAYQNILKNMNDILKEARGNAEGIRQLGKAAFDHLKEASEASSEGFNMTGRLSATEGLFDHLAPLYADEPKDINISELCNEIYSHIKAIPGIAENRLIMKIPPEFKCRVKGEMLRQLIAGLFDNLLALTGESGLKMMFESESQDVFGFLLKISAVMSPAAKDKPATMKHHAGGGAGSMDLLNCMFGSAVAFLGGSMAFGKSEGDIIVKITLRLRFA